MLDLFDNWYALHHLEKLSHVIHLRIDLKQRAASLLSIGNPTLQAFVVFLSRTQRVYSSPAGVPRLSNRCQ